MFASLIGFLPRVPPTCSLNHSAAAPVLTGLDWQVRTSSIGPSQLLLTGVFGEKLWVCSRPFALLPAWLLASLASLNRVHAVAGSGVGLARRNRTSRFRFCAVAAR